MSIELLVIIAVALLICDLILGLIFLTGERRRHERRNKD